MTRFTAGVVAALPMLAGAAIAQQPAPAPLPMPAVGEMAPDFGFRGATRYGLLAEPTRLSQLRGQTVVLAFFVVARTRG